MTEPRTFRKAFEILKYLAINPRKTAYALEKALAIDRPTVLATLKILLSIKFVRVVDQKKLETGLVRKSYNVTPTGMVALLQAHPENVSLSKEHVLEMARNYTDFLPLIFGKWNYFCERSVDDLAYKYLLGKETSIDYSEDQIGRLAAVAQSQEPENASWTDERRETVLRHDIYARTLLSWNYGVEIGDDLDRQRWLQAIRGDSELLALAEKEVFRLRLGIQEELGRWDDILEGLHGLPVQRHQILIANETSNALDVNLNYERAKALDEQREPPTINDLLKILIKVMEERWKRSGTVEDFSTWLAQQTTQSDGNKKETISQERDNNRAADTRSYHT